MIFSFHVQAAGSARDNRKSGISLLVAGAYKLHRHSFTSVARHSRGKRAMRVSLAVLVLPCILCCCVDVQADLIIDVQDASIVAGSQGFVDVLITSDADVLVSGFDLDFLITQQSAIMAHCLSRHRRTHLM